jgi:hypothetical protein
MAHRRRTVDGAHGGRRDERLRARRRYPRLGRRVCPELLRCRPDGKHDICERRTVPRLAGTCPNVQSSARDACVVTRSGARDGAQPAARPRTGTLECAIRKDRHSRDRVRDCISHGTGRRVLARSWLCFRARSGRGHAGARFVVRSARSQRPSGCSRTRADGPTGVANRSSIRAECVRTRSAWARLATHAIEPAGFLMTRRLLLGLKQRAEALRRANTSETRVSQGRAA